MKITADIRALTVRFGPEQEPVRLATRTWQWRPAVADVRLDPVTASPAFVELRGPVVKPDGADHAGLRDEWSWRGDLDGAWPPADAPPAAVAAVAFARHHVIPAGTGQLHGSRRAADHVHSALPADETRRLNAAYAWGRLLGVYGRYAELAGPAARDEHSKLLTMAFVTPTVGARMAEAAQRWWRAATSRTPRPDAAGLQVPDLSDLQARLDRYAVAATGLPATYLTLGEREQVICGYHHEHAALAALAGTPA